MVRVVALVWCLAGCVEEGYGYCCLWCCCSYSCVEPADLHKAHFCVVLSSGSASQFDVVVNFILHGYYESEVGNKQKKSKNERQSVLAIPCRTTDEGGEV